MVCSEAMAPASLCHDISSAVGAAAHLCTRRALGGSKLQGISLGWKSVVFCSSQPLLPPVSSFSSNYYNELLKCQNIDGLQHLSVAQDANCSHLPWKPRRVQHVLTLTGFINEDQVLYLPVICTFLMVIKSSGVILFVQVNSINWFSCILYIEHAKCGLSCQEQKQRQIKECLSWGNHKMLTGNFNKLVVRVSQKALN